MICSAGTCAGDKKLVFVVLKEQFAGRISTTVFRCSLFEFKSISFPDPFNEAQKKRIWSTRVQMQNRSSKRQRLKKQLPFPPLAGLQCS